MTSTSIPAELRRLVNQRALECCKYCLIHQDVSIYSHEVDHIIALKHGGQTRAENLALNGARIQGITQIGQATARLLKLNAPNRILERQILINQERYP